MRKKIKLFFMESWKISHFCFKWNFQNVRDILQCTVSLDQPILCLKGFGKEYTTATLFNINCTVCFIIKIKSPPNTKTSYLKFFCLYLSIGSINTLQCKHSLFGLDFRVNQLWNWSVLWLQKVSLRWTYIYKKSLLRLINT